MNFGADPLLMQSYAQQPAVGQPGQQYTPQQLAALDQELTNRLAALRQQQINLQPQPTRTPVWDEIDKLTDALTDGQRAFLNANEEWRESSERVAQILNREYLRIMRPVVEQTKDGKDALDRHLTLLKRLKKTAMQEEEERTAMMNDYMSNHSDMTWAEYVAARQKKKGGRR